MSDTASTPIAPAPSARAVPGVLKGLVGVLCGLTLLSALAGAYWGLAGLWPRVSWPLFAFELVTILACVFGLLVARGRFADSPGLTILCIAGLIMTGGVLGWLGANKVHAGVNLRPFMLSRLAVAGVLYALAAISEVWYSPSARRKLMKAGIFAIVFLGVVGGMFALRHSPIMDKMQGWREGVRLGGLALASVIALIGACGGVHLAVRAFTIAEEPEAGA